MLRARLATAAVAIPLLLAIIFLAPAWGWGVVVVVITVLAIVEYLRLAFGERLGPRLVGGVLDRIDSLLFPVVLVYYYLLATGIPVAARAC